MGGSLRGWCGSRGLYWLGARIDGEFVEFVDNFVVDGFARLIAVNVDEKAKVFIVLHDWEGFGVEFFKASMESFDVLIVAAVTTIAKGFGGDPTVFNVGFRDI